MAKGGRMSVKKSRRGIKKLGEESEDDDEYVVEEEDAESESYEESMASSEEDSGEDRGELGGDLAELSGSDRNFEEEEEEEFEFDDSEFEPEEEEEVRVNRSRKGRKKSVRKKTRLRRRVSDSEDEGDEDFESEDVPQLKIQRKSRKRVSDSEEEEDFERKEVLDLKNRRRLSKRVSDSEEEEEFGRKQVPELKNKRKLSKRVPDSEEEDDFERKELPDLNNQRKSRKRVLDSDSDSEEEDDFKREQVPDSVEEEDLDLDDDPPPPPLKDKNKKTRPKRRNKSDEESDYEEEAELDLDEEEEDFDLDEDDDFSPDISDEEEFLSVRKRKIGLKTAKTRRSPIKKRKSRVLRRNKTNATKKEKKNKRKRRRTKKNNPSKEPSTKRRRRIEEEEEEELLEDDFLDDDDEFLIEEQLESRQKTNKSRKRKPGSDSETSEFEFLTESEEESDEPEPELQIQTQTRPKRRKKHRTGSGSSSSDSDFLLYESDPDPPALNPVRERKLKPQKGKEKEKEIKEDSGRKVCGICLNEEQKRTTPGVLDCCKHFFCFACIIEWSKVESRCPVCKRRFETITKASSSDSDDLGFGAPSKVINVPKRDQVYQPSEEEMRGIFDPYENVVCMECQQGGDDYLMLLCDICDSSAHTYCVGLGHFVPEGNWYCDCCRSAGVGPSQPTNNTPFQTPNIPFQTPNIPFQVPPTPRAEPTPQLNPSEADIGSTPAESSSAGLGGLEIDLNAPPVEEPGPSQVASPSAGGAATLSGRRAIRHRIRILLSSTRAMQIVLRQNGDSVGGPTGENVNNNNVNNSNSQLPATGSSRFCPSSNVAGPSDSQSAKEKVWSVVKTHLRSLCLNPPLGHDEFKSVGRAATHAVLAACGIRVDSRNVVSGSGSIQPPQNCGHEIRTRDESSLLTDVCSDCFSLFVRDVVANILNS